MKLEETAILVRVVEDVLLAIETATMTDSVRQASETIVITAETADLFVMSISLALMVSASVVMDSLIAMEMDCVNQTF